MKRKRSIRRREVVDKGNTFRDYHYLGALNALENGTPINYSDHTSKIHDYDYQDIINHGEDPYWNYSEADEVARKKFRSDAGGELGRLFFSLKKAAWEDGLIGHVKYKKRRNVMKHFIHKKAK